MVYELQSYISDLYVSDTFDSCKNVIMSSTNGPAMDFLCGPWGAYRCTAQRWYDYMGSTSNGFSPFDIKYVYVNSSVEVGGRNMTPISPEAFHCSEVPPGGSKACSCVDCIESCPAAPVLPPKPGPFLLFKVDGMSVVMGIVFVMGSAVILLAAFMQGELGF
jgi:hypothetical protein